jgi:hypothetical protein
MDDFAGQVLNRRKLKSRRNALQAMLAFVLEHDLEFRKDFLEQVCERTHADDAKDFRVELEIPNCGDLVLRKRDNSEGCAFEIKVGAPVQDWNQNPRKRRFFTSGYGYGIRQQLWVSTLCRLKIAKNGTS